jgi:hypothetical protein
MADDKDFVKFMTLKILKNLHPTIVENSLEIKYYQSFKERYDVFGKFKDNYGYYEFAVSFEKNGKIKRSHINMIMPIKIRQDLEDKVYRES